MGQEVISMSMVTQLVRGFVGTTNKPSLVEQIGSTAYGAIDGYLLKKEPLASILLNVLVPIAGNFTGAIPKWLTLSAESQLGLELAILLMR